MSELETAIMFAQNYDKNKLYSIKSDLIQGSSERTAYRNLKQLSYLGLARLYRRQFRISSAIHQPLGIIKKLLPSIKSLKNARRFGKYYNQSDISFVQNKIDYESVTLDYKAWELTRFQNPSTLYMYVKDMAKTTAILKDNGFHSGVKGNVVILPIIGDINDEVERTYMDSIAKGGRNTFDAIALEIRYKDRIKTKGIFSLEDVLHVQENLNA